MNGFWKTILPGKDCTDENILLWLADGSPQQEQRVMDCLYRRLVARVVAWVLSKGGLETDGEDAMTLALEGFVKNYRAGKYTDEGKLENFVFSIAKFKFYDICRERKQRGEKTPLVSIEEIFPSGIPPGIDWEDPEEILDIEAESFARLLRIEQSLGQIGDKCKERLLRFIVHNESHAEIAKALGDSSEDVSKTMLSRCKNKLRELVFKNPKPKGGQI